MSSTAATKRSTGPRKRAHATHVLPTLAEAMERLKAGTATPSPFLTPAALAASMDADADEILGPETFHAIAPD